MEYLGDDVLVEILNYVPLKDRVLSTQHVNQSFHAATLYTMKNYLSFENEYWVNGANFKETINKCRVRLKHLNLTNCYWLNSEHFRPIFSCSNLTSLQLIGCTTITGKCLLKICSGLALLTELSLTVTEQLVKQVESELSRSNTEVTPKMSVTAMHLEFITPKNPLSLETFITNFFGNFLCTIECGIESFQIHTLSTSLQFWNLAELLPQFTKFLNQAKSVSLRGEIKFDALQSINFTLDHIHKSLSKFMSLFCSQCTTVIHRLAINMQGQLTELSIEFFSNQPRVRDICGLLNFPNLTFLSIKNFTEAWHLMEQIEAPNLHTLKLPTAVTGKDPKEVEWMNFLKRFPSLSSLNLCGREIPIHKIAELSSDSRYNTQMKSLSITPFGVAPNMSDRKISSLFCCSNLTKIKLCGFPNVGNKQSDIISQELSALSNVTTLQILFLSGFSYLQDFRFLITIAKSCKNLCCLNLKDLGPSGLAKYLRHLNKMLSILPQLQHLRLEHQAFDVTTSFVSALTNCSQLQEFCLTSAHGTINQEVFPLLAKLICRNKEIIRFEATMGSFSQTACDKMIKALKPDLRKRPALRVLCHYL